MKRKKRKNINNGSLIDTTIKPDEVNLEDIQQNIDCFFDRSVNSSKEDIMNNNIEGSFQKIKEKIKDFFQKIRRNIVNNKFKILAITNVVFFIIICGLYYYIPATKSVAYSNKIKISDEAYRKFRRITPTEINIQWLKSLEKYGNNKEDYQTSPYELFIASLGGNFKSKDAEEALKRINAFIEVQLTITVSNPKLLLPGDFIVFKGKWVGNRQIAKIGIIKEIVNGYVVYLDWDSTVGASWNSVRLGDNSVEKFVEFSFPMWAGTLLHNGIKITRGKNYNHTGVDMIMANYERSVYSFTDGIIVKAFANYNHARRWELQNSGGNYCIVKIKLNGETRYLQYFHLQNLSVIKNQRVKKDTYLGQYADLGNSTGPHLHLGMYTDYNEKTEWVEHPVDPMVVLCANTSFILLNENVDIKSFLTLNSSVTRV